MKRLFNIMAVMVVLVALVAFPVSAADSNGNEFIDMHEYATYTFPDNDSEVYVDCYFPTDWYSTAVYTKSFSESHYVGTFNGSPINFDTQYPGIQITMRPTGGSNMFTGSVAGKQVQNAHIIDLTAVPKKTSFHSSFSVTAYLGESDTPYEEMFYGTQVLYFVDKYGVVVHRNNLYVGPSVYVDQYGYYHFNYAYATDLSQYNLPDSVVGLVCVFTLEDAQQSVNYYVKEVSYTKFRFSYNLSALQYESQQNERLQNTMDNVQNALEEQNKKFDTIINSEIKPDTPPTPTTPDGDLITDELDKQEQELQGSAQEGLEQGKQTLTQALSILIGYMDAFHVVGSIFRQFAEMPFFAGLLTLSLAMGLVATLLGMALEVKSFSVAEEKRRNAEQEKARRDHDRAEYRRRMLERSK